MRFLFNLLNMLLYRKHASILPQKNIHNIKDSTILDKAWRSEKRFPRRRVFPK